MLLKVLIDVIKSIKINLEVTLLHLYGNKTENSKLKSSKLYIEF